MAGVLFPEGFKRSSHEINKNDALQIKEDFCGSCSNKECLTEKILNEICKKNISPSFTDIKKEKNIIPVENGGYIGVICTSYESSQQKFPWIPDKKAPDYLSFFER